jgi:DNA polymerase III psi subunit
LLIQKLNIFLDKGDLITKVFFVKYPQFFSASFGIDSLLSHKDELEHILLELLMVKNEIMALHPGLVEQLLAFEQAIDGYLWRLGQKTSFFQAHTQAHKKNAINAFQEVLMGNAALNLDDIVYLKQGQLGQLFKRFPNIIGVLNRYQDSMVVKIEGQKKTNTDIMPI